MSNSPIASLGLSCPNGGSFYICQGNTTQFLGCCTSDPCADGKGHCPQSDLRYASFDKADYSEIGSQACSNASSAQWYTCAETTEPFLGCCSRDACGAEGGCAREHLAAARLSDSEGEAAVFLTTTAPATTVGGSMATGPGSPQGHAPSGLSAGAKAGIGVGCAIAAIGLAAALLFARRFLRDRRGVVVRGSSPPTPSAMTNGDPKGSYQYYGRKPPPQHVSQGRQALIHSSDPNRILYTPPPSSPPANEPYYNIVASSRSPGSIHDPSYPAHSSSLPSSFNASTRQASVLSMNDNILGIMPSPSLDGSPEQTHQSRWTSLQQPARRDQYTRVPQYASPPPQQSPPLGMIAELDATAVPRPRSTSEDPASLARYPSPMYGLYTPSVQGFRNIAF